MSYERISGLGVDLKSFGPGGKTGIDRTPAPSQSTPSINKAGTSTSDLRLMSGVAPKKISVPTGSSTPMPPIPRGYIRVPIAERPGLKIWDVRLNGLAKVKMQLDRDPNYTSVSPGTLERFRKAKHRAELIAASQGVMCLSGSQMGSATGTLDWWRQCDREGWACWHPDAMMPVKYDLKSCVSAPTILLNYWVADRASRGGAVPCPTATIKDNLFGFAALASESSGSTAGRSFFPVNGSGKGQLPRTEDEASSQAVEEAIDAASQMQPTPPTAFVTTGYGPTDEPIFFSPGPDVDDTASSTTRYLMWGAVGLVAVGGIGYIVWKLSKKPKGMEANTEMERWQSALVRNPKQSGTADKPLPSNMPEDVKMAISTMVESAERYVGKYGEDAYSVYWAQFDNGSWIIGDNYDRIRKSAMKLPDGSWVTGLVFLNKASPASLPQVLRFSQDYFKGAPRVV